MASGRFDRPKVTINRVYTRTGDSGETRLAGGQRVPKNDLRIESYGTVDELNAFVGVAVETARLVADPSSELRRLVSILIRVQHELFNLGSILSTRAEDVRPSQPTITDSDIKQLEEEIDGFNEQLPELKSFVLPGSGRLNADLHVCRTVCRRAERLCVALNREESIPQEIIRYLNRLSDAFFVWSRWVSKAMNLPERLWDPNQR